MPILASKPFAATTSAAVGQNLKTAEQLIAEDATRPIVERCSFPPFEVPYLPQDLAPGQKVDISKPAGRIIFWLGKDEPNTVFANAGTAIPAGWTHERGGTDIGTAYDSNGHWWLIRWAPADGFCDGDHFGVRWDGCVTKFQGCYAFSRAAGKPDYAHHDVSFFEKINTFVEKTVIPIAIAIAGVINPGVGIAAGIVYAGVEKIVSGASLTDTVIQSASDAVKAEVGSVTASRYLQQGLDLVRSGKTEFDISKTRAAIASAVGGNAGVLKSFETGVGLAQAQLIQAHAINDLKAKLPPAQQAVADTALSYGASLTDLAIGFYGDAQGSHVLKQNINAATQKVAPQAAARLGISGSSNGGNAGGIGAVLLVGGLGFLAIKLLSRR